MTPPTRGGRPGNALPGSTGRHRKLLGALVALAAAAAVGTALWLSRANAPPTAEAARATAPATAPLVAESIPPIPSVPERDPDATGQLKSGETLGVLLSRRLGLTPVEAQAAASSAGRYLDLRQLRAGSEWRAYLSDVGQLERFQLAVAARGELTIDRRAEEWQPSFAEYRKESRLVSVRGRLEGSLEASVEATGAPGELAYAMADVLQWDLDFTRDLQPGDEFRVLFEEVRIERSQPSVGRVLAVDYGRADGRRLEAYAFDADDSAASASSPSGYYDAEGRPLQKMFLRAPLPYSRVTSRFSNKRLHPVLGVFRPHHGVDYGAPTGTPVRVTASGTVVSASWDGGGGRVVKVRHPNDYLTAYLHLSRFATGIRAGARVRQGDIVGYVGSTGLATAPHLDYRIQRSGRWIDPLKLESIPAQEISQLRLGDFRSVRDAMRRSLESGAPFEPPFALAGGASRVAAGESEAQSSDATTTRRAAGAT